MELHQYTPGDGTSRKRQSTYRGHASKLNKHGPRSVRAQGGGVMAEFIVVLPMLLLIALGSIQWAFIYQAKVTVEHATFMAARAGSVSGADIGDMRNAFAKGILPLYSPDKDAPLGLDAGAGLKAWRDSRHWGTVNVGGGATQMLILNPTREAFDDHGEQVGSETIIRNDRLHLKSMEVAGTSGVSIQDANLLKVHVLYGYEMKLPFISRVLTWIGTRSTSNVAKQAMWRAGRIPVLATSTVRMQSDAKLSDNVLAMGEVDELLTSDSLPLISGHSYEGHRPWQMGPSGGDGGGPLGGIGGLGLPFVGEGGGGVDPKQFGNDDGGSSGGSGGPGDPGGPGGGLGPDVGGPDDGDNGGGGDPGDCDPDDATCGDDGDDDLGAVDCDSDEGGGGGGDGDGAGRATDSSGLNGTGSMTPTSQAMNLPGVMVGNPINVVTGNKYQAEVDIRGAVPFVRHYNSQTSHRGRMGNNWRHSYEVSVRSIVSADGSKRMRVTQADGRTISFEATPAPLPSSVPNPASVEAVYAARMPADGLLLERGKQGYDWVRESSVYGQTILEFNDSGFLSAITAVSNGEELTKSRTQMLYDASGTQLMAVAGPNQERLGFAYYKTGRLKKLTDAQGMETRFTYDGEANLTTVKQGTSLQKQYHYEDPHDANNLTGVSVDDKRIATYGYDEKDRANYSAHGDTLETVSLVYGDSQLVASDDGVKSARSTKVTDGAGVTSTYHTELRDGIPLVTQINGPGCDECSAGDVKYEYNDNHQVTEVSYKNGVTRVNSYDELGRLEKRESTDKSGATKLIAEYSYVGNTNAVQSVSRPSTNPQSLRTVDVQYTASGQLDKAIESTFKRSTDGAFTPITNVTTFDYADDGKLVGIERVVDGVSQRTEYGYDAEGKLSSRQLPDGSRLEVLARNAQGRPSHISAVLPSVTTQEDGQSVARAKNYTLEYDEQGGIASISDGERSWDSATSNAQAPQSSVRSSDLPGELPESAQSDVARTVAAIELNAVISDVERFEAAGDALENGSVDDPALRNTLSRDECDENAEECAAIANGQRYGELSQCIYTPATCQSPNIDDEWQAVDPSQLGLEEDDFIDGGFAAGVYQSSETGEYTIVFRGTDNASDWIDNLGQGAGFTTSQYEMALELARAVRDGLPADANITVTGHSLGGGLATAAALELGVSAVVFNAAGLTEGVAEDNNLDLSQANNLIDLYHVEGEILTSAQDLGPYTIPLPFYPFYTTIEGPSAPGERFGLPRPSEEWMEANTSDAWYLPDALEEAIQLHLMESVMQSLQEQSDALGCE